MFLLFRHFEEHRALRTIRQPFVYKSLVEQMLTSYVRRSASRVMIPSFGQTRIYVALSRIR